MGVPGRADEGGTAVLELLYVFCHFLFLLLLHLLLLTHLLDRPQLHRNRHIEERLQGKRRAKVRQLDIPLLRQQEIRRLPTTSTTFKSRCTI